MATTQAAVPIMPTTSEPVYSTITSGLSPSARARIHRDRGTFTGMVAVTAASARE